MCIPLTRHQRSSSLSGALEKRSKCHSEMKDTFFMQSIKIPIIDIETEYVYSQALRFFLYAYLWGQWRKRDFVRVALSRGMSRSTAERIWVRWAYVNKYISIAHSDFCSISSLHKIGNVFAVVTSDELSKVTSLNAFKNFMIWLQAGRPHKVDRDISYEEEYLRHNKSITLNGLAKKNGLSCKQSAHRRMKSALNTFWGKKTTRYAVYNGKLARLSNIYSNSIEYIYNKYSHYKAQATKWVKCTYMNISRSEWVRHKIQSKLEWLRPEEYGECYNNLYI